jgi:hypothetical protein
VAINPSPPLSAVVAPRRLSTDDGSYYVPSSDGDRELLWKQYALHIDLYKYYLDITLKGVTLSYGITGALITYVFGKGGDHLLVIALLLPVLVSLALAGVFLYGARLLKYSIQEVEAISVALGLQVPPEMSVLGVVLRAFALVLVLTAIGLAVIVVTQWPR